MTSKFTVKRKHVCLYWTSTYVTPLYMRTIVQIGSSCGAISGGDVVFGCISKDDNVYLVEPIKHIYKKLVENYEEKYPGNKFVFINKAVSNYNGIIKMYTPDEEELKIKTSKQMQWQWGVSSVIKSHPGNHWGQIKKVNEIDVECITLSKLVEENNLTSIDLLQIDTEGHDLEILLAYDYAIKPKNIVFENAHTDGTRRRGENYENFIKFIEEKGYEVVEETKTDTTLKLIDL